MYSNAKFYRGNKRRRPFHSHGLTLLLALISNYIHKKTRHKIVQVLVWINNLMSHFTESTLRGIWNCGIRVSRCTSFPMSDCLPVCPSVCGRNRVRCISSTILARFISHLFIVSSNCGRYVAIFFWEIRKNIFKGLTFFKVATLTLSCVHVMW